MNPNKYTKLTREDPRRGTIDQAKSKRHFFQKPLLLAQFVNFLQI